MWIFSLRPHRKQKRRVRVEATVSVTVYLAFQNKSSSVELKCTNTGIYIHTGLFIYIYE